MNTPIVRCRSVRTPLLALAALAAACFLIAPRAAAQAQVTGGLANFDVRYPSFICPDDLEVIVYGNLRDANDVVDTWDTSILLGGVGLGWGKASERQFVENWVGDPTSPGYGLARLRLRPTRRSLAKPNCRFHASQANPWLASYLRLSSAKRTLQCSFTRCCHAAWRKAPGCTRLCRRQVTPRKTRRRGRELLWPRILRPR